MKLKFNLGDKKKDLLAISLITLVIITFLWRGASMQGIFFSADETASDLIHYSYPYKQYWADEYLKKGKLPLWNPYITSGLPFLAQAETGVFNPLAILLFLFLPSFVAFNWLIISCFILTGIGTYFYSRTINLSRVAAMYAGSVFALSGFFVGHLRHVPILTSLAYMPFIFLLTERLILSFQKTEKISKKTILLTIILALLIALSIFGGHLSTSYSIILILTIYLLSRSYFLYRGKILRWLRLGILFICSLILGAFFSAIQLIPTFELIPNSSRVIFSFYNSISVPYQIKYLLLFILPYFFGDPSKATWPLESEKDYWEVIGYIGILPLLLGLIALILAFKLKSLPLKGVALIFIISFLLVLGDNVFIYKLFWDFVPWFKMARIPGRFLLFMDFSLAIAAGYVVFYLQQKIKSQLSKLIIICLIYILSIFDLFIFGSKFNVVMPLNYFDQPQTVKFLKEDKDIFKILQANIKTAWLRTWNDSGGWRGNLSFYFLQRQLLPPDFQLLFHLTSSLPLHGSNIHFGVNRSSYLDILIFKRITTAQKLPSDKLFWGTLLGMENVKYIISLDQASQEQYPDFKLIKEFPSGVKGYDTFIYQNLKYLPRAYLVFSYSSFNNTDKLLSRMFSNDFDPSKEVLLEEDPQKPQTQGGGEVSINSYQDSKVEISVNSLNGGFLVLSDTYYPGWKAYIDGKETKIYQANYAYRAIYLDKGEHKIVFNYDPLSVKIGALISLLTFVFATSLILFLKFRPIKNE